MASKNLPTNIDATYTDDTTDATVKLHQQYHDALHAVVNLFDYDALAAAAAGYYLYADPATGLISVVAPPSTVTVNLLPAAASYTLVAADAGKVVETSHATANSVTVPAGVFSTGQQVGVTQTGAGITSFTAGAGMVIRSEGGLTSCRGQWADVLLRFRTPSECVLSGNLA